MVEPIAAALAVRQTPLEGRGVILGADRIAILVERVLEGVPRIATRDGLHAELDFAIETTGEAADLEALIERLRPGGRLILKSRPADAIALPLARIVERRLELYGAGYGSFP